MRRTTAQLALASTLTCALALLASGCQGAPAEGDGTPPSGMTTTPGGTGGGGGSATIPSAEHQVAGAFTGPLEELLGWTASGTVQTLVDEQRRQEDLIAACMHEQGFDYTPDVPAVSDVVVVDGPVRGTREFVELYGYGFWNASSAEGGEIGIRVGDSEQRRYVEAMSAAEREAYDTALHGPVTEAFDDGSVTRSGGCMDQVHDGGSFGDRQLEDTHAAATEFLLALPVDSAFDELNAEWATCMRDAGWAEASPHLAQQRFADAALGQGSDSLGESLGESLGSDENAGSVTTARAEEMAAEELAVALADLDCQDEVDYVRRYDEIDLRLQTEYVEANRADLEALAARLAG